MMKKQNIFLILLLVLVGSISCTTENNNPVISDSDAVTGNTSLNLLQPVSGGAYILNESEATNVWETFIWKNVNTAQLAPVTYTLEVTCPDNVADTAYIGSYTSASAEVTEGELNDAMNTLGFTAPGKMANLRVRVKEMLGASIVYYSQTDSFTAIGYGKKVTVIPTLGVVGSLQGWNNGDVYKLFSTTDNKIYTGYVNLPNANDEFKLLYAAGSWDGYGSPDGAAGTTGALAVGADNIKPQQAAGTYLLTADINMLTWTLTAAPWTAIDDSWGVVGVLTGWADGADIPMVYNASNGLLEATVDLTAGTADDQGFKFRANGKWDVNYGDNEMDGIAENGGTNLFVTVSGTYLLQLDLRNPDQVTYKVTLQ